MSAATISLPVHEPEVIIRPMLTIDRSVDLFLGDLSRRGYSERTRSTYSRILDKLCDRLPQDQDVSKVTTDDLRRFLDLYQGRKQRGKGNYSKGTQAHAESVLGSFFGWLIHEQKIARDPMANLQRTRRIPAQDLDVVTVSSDDVRKLMKAAATISWSAKLVIWLLVYTGARRRAIARLKLADYSRDHYGAGRPGLRFREKGGKVIWKPVPTELASVLEAAIAAGCYQDQDWLVPSDGGYIVLDERDDRVVWRLVRDVADKAGVKTHVHALRAAFAVFYLENNVGDIEALRELMGHRSLATTQTYLRRLDRGQAMERVRDLSWGVEAS